MARASSQLTLAPYQPKPVRPLPFWLKPLAYLVGTFSYLTELGQLIYRALISIFWEGKRGRRLGRHILLQQIYFTACQSFWLTCLVGVAIGSLLMSQASVVLLQYGFPDYAEWLTVKILFKEIGPMTVALIIIARSANAIVIEIGNMKVNGELRALEVLGINLDRYLALPRIVGMTVSLVLLTISFCFASLYGGFLVAEVAGLLESNFLLDSLVEQLTRPILLNILARAFCFGIVIGAVSCLHGLRVQRSPTEVPQQASKGVVRALAICFFVNFFISLYFSTDTTP